MPVMVVSSDPPEAISAALAPDAPAPTAAPAPAGDPGASAPPASPAAPEPAAPAPPDSAPDVPDPVSPETTTEEDEEEVPGIPKGVQRRIDREVRRRHEADRKAAALEARLQMLEQGYQRPSQEPAPVPLHERPEPREEDYASQQEWFRAVRDWDKAQLKQELQREAYQRQVQQLQDAQQAKMQEQAQAARQKYADFDAVLDRLQAIATVPALDACVHESDLGAELAYYLAQHPETIARLNQLAQTAPLAMAREVGKLELQLSAPTNGSRSPSPAAVPTAQPPPPQPVSGTGAPPPTGYHEDMTHDEFNRMFPYTRRGR